ncbi:CLUMA_CG005600, isoform A [Clunio marinus]|uniref:CLUMA_CG005600, isoform A n=1 Tax=Clunio marinus TaxID=568069 RepID=A0A1J1HXE4_9DIPT|nr:CLUMA_CG005600, isoform A [Clunio marinus]
MVKLPPNDVYGLVEIFRGGSCQQTSRNFLCYHQRNSINALDTPDTVASCDYSNAETLLSFSHPKTVVERRDTLRNATSMSSHRKYLNEKT